MWMAKSPKSKCTQEYFKTDLKIAVANVRIETSLLVSPKYTSIPGLSLGDGI